jgi:DNA gyrase/topoisomerase IV subunit B
MKWLKLNSEYTTELNRLEARSACDPLVVEFVCYADTIAKNDNDFKAILEEHFPEMTYDIRNMTLSGSLNGQSTSLIVDSIFWKAAKKFMKILKENYSIFIHVKNKNDENDRYQQYTIGEFLYKMENTYTIKIQQRYKGIGEMEAEEIFATTLNPKLRRLIRFNMDNVQETKEVFDLLHAKTAEMRQLRRDLLDNSEIGYMDLDN